MNDVMIISLCRRVTQVYARGRIILLCFLRIKRKCEIISHNEMLLQVAHYFVIFILKTPLNETGNAVQRTLLWF